jgi:hypothetical protein
MMPSPRSTEEPAAPAEQSTFLQRIKEGDPVSNGLSLVSMAVGAVTWVCTRSWAVAVVAALGFYLAAGLLYTGLSYIFGWRRLRWFAFFGEALGLLEIFRP